MATAVGREGGTWCRGQLGLPAPPVYGSPPVSQATDCRKRNGFRVRDRDVRATIPMEEASSAEPGRNVGQLVPPRLLLGRGDVVAGRVLLLRVAREPSHLA